MIGFILLSIALLALVMWLIAPALLSQQKQIVDTTKQTNIVIAREKLAELENQLKQNEITQQQYDQSRDEIELALLEDTVTEESTRSELPNQYKRNIFVLLTAIPFVAFGLYQYWGEPQAISASVDTASTQTQTGQDQQKHAGSMEEVLARLEAKLQQDPNNPDGWYTLARTYMVQQQYGKAAEAFRQLHTLVGDQAEVLLGMADALTMSRNGDMRGEPFELAKRALEIAPENPTALWLTGLGYRDNGDLTSALSLWKKLLPLVAGSPQSSHEVQTLIDDAERQLASSATQTPLMASPPEPSPLAPTASATASIKVQINIDPTLRASVSDTDIVMIYAQRVEGMKMPLAMYDKAQIKDLPMTVTLNDSLSLSPMNKLSGEQQVNIIARISKSTRAIKQAGDIETKIGPVPVTSSEPITIMITR